MQNILVLKRVVCTGALALAVVVSASAEIDTRLLEQPWPKPWVHEYEVGKYPVQWRQRLSTKEGIFAGASFTAPSSLEETWRLANAYQELATMTPGVYDVQMLEQTATGQVIQVRMKVLWKMLTLIFEIEQDPPHATRFRLRHRTLGEYQGVCLLRPEGQQTAVELATWFKPAVKVPSRLVVLVERLVMLHGIRDFLVVCERPSAT